MARHTGGRFGVVFILVPVTPEALFTTIGGNPMGGMTVRAALVSLEGVRSGVRLVAPLASWTCGGVRQVAPDAIRVGWRSVADQCCLWRMAVRA